jgi:hypothetical protein
MGAVSHAGMVSLAGLAEIAATTRRARGGLRAALARPAAARLATVLALAAWGAGAIGRAVYALALRHPRHSTECDAKFFLDLAERMLAAPATQNDFSTVWPPGTPAVFAAFASFDPSLHLAAAFQVVLSWAVPLLLARAALLVAGRRVALFVLAAASLHFGLAHFAAFFLAEQLFQAAVALALLASLSALALDERIDGPGQTRSGAAASRLGIGAGVGLVWTFAASFRPNALPVAVILGGVLAARFAVTRRWRSIWMIAGAAVGLMVSLAPLAHRCTELRGGHLCAISSNVTMNVALGQIEGSAGIQFGDSPDPAHNSVWWPPALSQHGYSGIIHVPFTVYEDQQILHWVWQRIAEDPERFFLRSLRNAIDLFRFDYWPPDFGPLSSRAVKANQWLFLAVVLLPGIVGLRRLAQRALRRCEPSSYPAALAAVVGGLLVTSALSLGEARYRFPFDGLFMIAAGSVLLREPIAGGREQTDRRAALAGVIVPASLAIAGLVLITAVAHPAFGVGPRLVGRLSPAAPTAPVDVRPAAAFAAARADHTAWNATGTYRFACRMTCPELRLAFDAVQTARAIELSVDNNDRYRVTFYRDGIARGHIDAPRADGDPGLRVVRLAVPEEAAHGYDTVGVWPLYGDGSYALGHLRPVP